MPLSEKEIDQKIKALQQLYRLDDQGRPLPSPTASPAATPNVPLVRAMDMDGNVVEVPLEEAKKKGYYVLPPTK